ncbi:MAG: hypothetical protein Rubg2KO_36920 [Rubricoccaceae bacterium]
MAVSASSSFLDRLRQRVETLPLDRAPLRRAGLLTGLLIGLLVLGKVLSPVPEAPTDRQEVRPATEEVSAPRTRPMWTGGRVLALLFLATGGGIAFWLHRRAGARTVSHGSTLTVLETHALGPNQSLRLVACGEEVLLLSVASDGATLLRHWPRETFEAEPVSFASALASLTEDHDDALASSTPTPFSNSHPKASPLPMGEGQGEGLGAPNDLVLASSDDHAPAHRCMDSRLRGTRVAEDGAANDGKDEWAENEPMAPTLSMGRAGNSTPVTSSTDAPSTERPTASHLHGQDATNEILEDELATSGPVPIMARGTLFPARAPRQFDV